MIDLRPLGGTRLDFKDMTEKLEPVGSSSFNEYALVDRPKVIGTQVNSWVHHSFMVCILGLPLLLCHGDMWVNNIIFEKSPDGTASNRILAIIDWQSTFSGNPSMVYKSIFL